MDHSTLQHHQEIMEAESLESMLVSTKQSQSQGQKQQDQKKPRPAEEAVKCPRCDSTNTKFCYYNNYSLSQPRYFCKSCRRYWTQGGTLRNVPVGGGCRKNRRAPTSSGSRRAPTDHHQFLAASCTPTSSSLSDFSPASYGNSNIALLGMNMNPGNSHFALLGNSLGFLDGAVLNPFGLGENAENGRGNSVNNFTSHDMGIHQQLDHQHNQAEIMSCNSSVTSSPTRAFKHEVGENRSSSSVFLGLPWQLSGGDHQGHNYMMMNNFGGGNQSDYVRESWTNGVLGSSWHNLLNSPLI